MVKFVHQQPTWLLLLFDRRLVEFAKNEARFGGVWARVLVFILFAEVDPAYRRKREGARRHGLPAGIGVRT